MTSRHIDQAPGFNASRIAVEIARNSDHTPHACAVLAHLACRYGRSLRAAHVRQCNGFQTWDHKHDQAAKDRNDKRIERLRKGLIEQFPESMHSRIYLQADPRGPCARLLAAGKTATESTSYGLAIE